MNVDSYSDLQEFEFPIGIGPQENIVAAEEFTSKQLRYSIHYFLNYQLNDYNWKSILSEGDSSELVDKSVRYAKEKKFVFEKDYMDPSKTIIGYSVSHTTHNMTWALYNALILIHDTPSISFEELIQLVVNYTKNVEDGNAVYPCLFSNRYCVGYTEIMKPYYFIDNFLMKYHKKPFTFTYWSTRYHSIYNIFNSLLSGHPVLVRVDKRLYFSKDPEEKSERVENSRFSNDHITVMNFYRDKDEVNHEHYIVLVGLYDDHVIAVDSSVDGFIRYCPLKSLLYSIAPGLLHTNFETEFFRFYSAWDLSLLL